MAKQRFLFLASALLVSAVWDAVKQQSLHLSKENSVSTSPTEELFTTWQKTPFGPQFKFQAHSKGATFGKKKSQESVVVVITARDLYIGCHSFEQYLGKSFETIFAFDEKYAKLWKMEEMVKNQTPETTMGAYLVIGDAAVGENSARKIGLEYIQNIAEEKADFLWSCNCDIHPIPTTHANYQSFEFITNKLASTMANEKRLREGGPGSFVQRKNIEKDSTPIFAMNTILWLRFNSSEHLLDAKWHGADHYHWYKTSFLAQKEKPLTLAKSNVSWTIEVDYFVESHALIFDVEKMAKIQEEYFIWDSMPSETHAIGLLANKHGWGVRRHNELHMHFDQIPEPETMHSHIFEPIKKKEDLDAMKFMNFELAAKRRNPYEGILIYDQYIRKNGVDMPDYYGGGFISFIWRPHYIPSSVQNVDALSEPAQRWINTAMKLAGWNRTGQHEFEILGPYAGATEMERFNHPVKRDLNVFLAFKNKDMETNIVSHDVRSHPVNSTFPVEKRRISFPIQKGTILDVQSGPLGQRDVHGWRYFHVIREQCKAPRKFDVPLPTDSSFMETNEEMMNQPYPLWCVGCD
eukprot:jgi/Bigna1/79603/fgenesh1_pg.63_\